MSDTAKGHAATLRKTAIFADLADNELRYVVDRVVQRRFSAGEMIFSEGDPCPGLWVVETGKIKIFKVAESGREQILTFEGPGRSMAELPVFDGGNYPASAVAVADSTLLFVSKEDFCHLCLKCPEVALKALRVVAGRLRNLVGIIEELSFSTVRHRLGAFLLRLARHGAVAGKGADVVLPAGHQEIAAQIGTVRELVSRGLSRLQATGIIEVEGRRIRIKDLTALERDMEDPPR